MSKYFEPIENLDANTKDMARALDCLKEDLELIDLYTQRMCASDNEDLKSLLCRNRDQKIQHVCMTLEWLRRNSKTWECEMKNFLFTQEPILKVDPNPCWRPKSKE